MLETGYRIRTSTNGIVATLGQNTTFYIETGLSPDTTHYRFCEAYNTYGSSATFLAQAYTPGNSPPSTFGLICSSGIVITQTPLFDWTDSVDPDPGDSVSYTIRYSSTNFVSFISSGGMTASQYQPAISLFENATYLWNVIASDRFGANVFSSTWTVIINETNSAPTNFTLITPSGTITTPTPVFDWTESSDIDPGGAVTYTIKFSSTNFLVFYSSSGLTASQFPCPFSLVENASYKWIVYAEDNNAEKTFTSTWTFLVNATNESPLSFNLSSPTDNLSLNTAAITLTWQTAPDPDINDIVSYKVYYSMDNWISTVTVSGVTNTSYELRNLSEGTTYWWKVEAIDSLNAGTMSLNTTWHFYIQDITPPPRIQLLKAFDYPSDNGGKIIITWPGYIPPSDIGKFVVYYANSRFDAQTQNLYESNINCSSYVVSALVSNTSDYYFTVVPVDISGNAYRTNLTCVGPVRAVRNIADTKYDGDDIIAGFNPETKVYLYPNTNNNVIIDVLKPETDNPETGQLIDSANNLAKLDVSIVSSNMEKLEDTITEFKSNVPLQSDAKIYISYKNIEISAVQENKLKIFVLNTETNKWEILSKQVLDKAQKKVIADVNHFSFYRLMVSRLAASNLDNVYVYPNPCKIGATGSDAKYNAVEIVFKGLTEKADIKIFNVAGELIYEALKDDKSDEYKWDLTNSAGTSAASGIYIYLITSQNLKKTGRLAIVR